MIYYILSIIYIKFIHQDAKKNSEMDAYKFLLMPILHWSNLSSDFPILSLLLSPRKC